MRIVVLLLALAACSKDAPSKKEAALDAAVAPKPERWGGAILLPQQQPLEFEVTLTASTGTISIPAQGMKDTALDGVTFDATQIVFTLPNAGPADAGVFSLTRTGDKAVGTLDQRGASMKVKMKRLADGEHVGDGTRAQDPKPPFPYEIREAAFASKDNTKLAGTLTIPKGAGPHPAVLLISGSGVQDRNGEIAGHRGFWVLADHLTRAGIAVLRVDDRGIGGSGGDTMAAGIEDKVDDARAALDWLAGQADIDRARLGVIGHSEGGAYAPIVARNAKLAAVVLLGAPGVTGARLAMDQNEAQLRAAGTDEAVIQAQLTGMRAAIDVQVAGGDEAAIRAAVTEHIDHMATIVPADQRAKYEGASREQMIETSVAALTSKAQRSFSLLDPKVALAGLRVPVLALTGALDLQVDATVNLAEIGAALKMAGNPDVTLETLPGLNHLFQPARTGLPVEYPLIDVTFDLAAMDKIAAWLSRRIGSAPTDRGG